VQADYVLRDTVTPDVVEAAFAKAGRVVDLCAEVERQRELSKPQG
jgi:hypothetical protein